MGFVRGAFTLIELLVVIPIKHLGDDKLRGGGDKPLGGGIWNNGSSLKLQRFPCDGILTLEPEESRRIL